MPALSRPYALIHRPMGAVIDVEVIAANVCDPSHALTSMPILFRPTPPVTPARGVLPVQLPPPSCLFDNPTGWLSDEIIFLLKMKSHASLCPATSVTGGRVWL